MPNVTGADMTATHTVLSLAGESVDRSCCRGHSEVEFATQHGQLLQGTIHVGRDGISRIASVG